MIKEFRFTTGKDRDYFFIYNLQGIALMHPNASLEGTNMLRVKDPNGFAFIEDILEKARQNNQGYSTYTWDKPGFSEPVTKLASYQTFTPWNLVVINGVYLDGVSP